jgi:AAA domain
VGESRTLASLLWRLDHQRLTLDARSVVILDEVGMTDDAHLVALTARIEAAGAKLVLVGDHHQLGAVGPGGALAALVRRHPDVVHQLTENRRQHHPGERRALAELRDGQVADAVTWYASHGRVHAVPDRDDALGQTVRAWAADVAAGHATGLYAWRRANVAALNQQARQWMHAAGRLSGPELVCPGGGHYRAGDHVVTLAPAADGRLITSQAAVIAAVDVAEQTLTLQTDNGQLVALARDQAGSDRLDYGYATTVHRSQGSTTERAHLFADGGGRELAYVAMSRARYSTQVWTVADDLAQAVDDLRRDWSTRRTPTWAIDTALPDPTTITPERFQTLPPDRQARLAALLHAEAAIAGHAIDSMRLPNRADTLGQAETALAHAQQARHDLETGTGVWQNTDEGRAVRDLTQAPAKKPTCGQSGNSTPNSSGKPTSLPPSTGSTKPSPSTEPASSGEPNNSSTARPPAEPSSTTGSNNNATPEASPNASPPTATTSTASPPTPRYGELPHKEPSSRVSRQQPGPKRPHHTRREWKCKRLRLAGLADKARIGRSRRGFGRADPLPYRPNWRGRSADRRIGQPRPGQERILAGESTINTYRFS